MESIKLFVETVPYVLLVAYLIWSTYYVRKAKRNPEKINKYVFELIPQIFTTIGILGTFMGIAVGLFFFDVKDMESSIPVLLGGLKTAFIASIFGIVFYFLFSKWTAYVQNQNEEGKQSDETIALYKLIDLVTEMKYNFGDSFIYTDENNNRVTRGIKKTIRSTSIIFN